MFEIEGLKYKHVLDIPHLVLDHPITCIVGASGSGKTTLLRHLNRLYAPDAGRIRYDGEDLAAMDPVELRRRVVMLGTDSGALRRHRGDNLQIGLKFAQRLPLRTGSYAPPWSRWAWASRRRTGATSSPAGRSSGLPGPGAPDGPETYLLDEPSAALDKSTEDFVIGHLAEHARKNGKRLVIVTHSEQVSARFPGIWCGSRPDRREDTRDEQQLGHGPAHPQSRHRLCLRAPPPSDFQGQGHPAGKADSHCRHTHDHPAHRHGGISSCLCLKTRAGGSRCSCWR